MKLCHTKVWQIEETSLNAFADWLYCIWFNIGCTKNNVLDKKTFIIFRPLMIAERVIEYHTDCSLFGQYCIVY